MPYQKEIFKKCNGILKALHQFDQHKWPFAFITLL